MGVCKSPSLFVENSTSLAQMCVIHTCGHSSCSLASSFLVLLSAGTDYSLLCTGDMEQTPVTNTVLFLLRPRGAAQALL